MKQWKRQREYGAAETNKLTLSNREYNKRCHKQTMASLCLPKTVQFSTSKFTFTHTQCAPSIDLGDRRWFSVLSFRSFFSLFSFNIDMILVQQRRLCAAILSFASQLFQTFLGLLCVCVGARVCIYFTTQNDTYMLF